MHARSHCRELFEHLCVCTKPEEGTDCSDNNKPPVCTVPKCHTHKPDDSDALWPQELRADRSNNSMPFTFIVPEACSGGDLVLVTIPPIIYSVVSLVLPPGKLPGSDLTFHAPNGALLQ